MTRRLRIALLAHIRHPIARPFMGGMESHAWHLAKSLVERGHDVTLFASGDSNTAARLHPTIARHYDVDMPWHDFHGTEALNAVLDTAFGHAIEEIRCGDYDVVHNNSLHGFPPRLSRCERIAMVTSLHIPPFKALRRAVHSSAAPWSHFTVCSEVQRTSWWPEGAPTQAHVVPNGIDLDVWPFNPEGDGSAVWCGRITPTKGAHLAIQAARVAGMPLTLFGVIEHREYFEEHVLPLLGGTIRYAGHLSQRELAREIARASVFVFTPLWDEPFGLVAAEAMAAGVPVAALDNGSAREVVGEAGAIATDETVASLAEAIRLAREVHRDIARNRAAEHYSIDRMLDRYEALYDQSIAGLETTHADSAHFTTQELPPRRGSQPSLVVAEGRW